MDTMTLSNLLSPYIIENKMLDNVKGLNHIQRSMVFNAMAKEEMTMVECANMLLILNSTLNHITKREKFTDVVNRCADYTLSGKI